MKAGLSLRLLEALERHTPEIVAVLEIQVLTRMTARAFGVPGKRVPGLSARRAFEVYARFSAYCADRFPEKRPFLRREAFRLGRRLRKAAGLTRDEDLTRLVLYLYKNLGITMEGTLPGRVRIPACSFCRLYAPETCAVMSAADEGIMAGILGEGDLTFSGRLTAGAPCCQAVFTRRSEKDDISKGNDR